jgi:hypothetical protein
MDLGEVGRIVLKHKVVAGILLVATVGAAAAAFMKAPLPYQTEAALVVLAPIKQVPTGPQTTDDVARTVNPFLNFGGSQETAAQVLVVRMSDDVVGQKLETAGVRSEWKFDIKGGAGPVIQVTATGSTAAQSEASAQQILAAATDQLATLQRDAGSPDDQMIRAAIVNTPSDPQPVYDTKIRLSLLVAALGLLLTVAVPLAIEGVKRARATAGPDQLVDETDETESLDALALDWIEDDRAEPDETEPDETEPEETEADLDERISLDELVASEKPVPTATSGASFSAFSQRARDEGGDEPTGSTDLDSIGPDAIDVDFDAISRRRLAAASRQRAS